MSDDRWGEPSGSQDPGLPPPPAQTAPAGWDAGGEGWQPQQPAGPQTNGPAVAAVVCGIIALLLSWIPVVNVLSLVLGVVAVVTGILGLRRASDPRYGQRGLAVGGLVTGGLGLLVALAILAFIGSLFADPGIRDDIMEEIEREMERQEELEREGGFTS